MSFQRSFHTGKNGRDFALFLEFPSRGCGWILRASPSQTEYIKG